ncbi:MarR family protein [uncultured archaeon]|nr:MarR family protein [uncultured archaeon]
MRNRNVGYLLLGIAVVVGIILVIFSNTAHELDSTCPLVQENTFCPSSAALSSQIYFSIALIILLVLVALFLIFSKENKEVVIKKIKEKQKQKVYDLTGLNKEEKQVFELVKKENAMFQADLIDKLGFGKAKVTRIIDRLEGRGLVERKRRGMNNIVALK